MSVEEKKNGEIKKALGFVSRFDERGWLGELEEQSATGVDPCAEISFWDVGETRGNVAPPQSTTRGGLHSIVFDGIGL